MPGRRRCQRCHRPQTLCLCALIRPIANTWPVHILQHPQESQHALGTARIAHLGLLNSSLIVCANPVSTTTAVIALAESALIYPGDESQPLSELYGNIPRTLIFIDATWRKSRRMLFESPALAALPRYSLQAPPPSRYRIRKEPFAAALSTLEAIVHTLALLEDSPTQYQPLLQWMDALVEQQIGFMGRGTFENNYPSVTP